MNVKEYKKPYTALYPVPVVLVSCSDGRKDNLITLAWVGTVCSDPPMLSISVRPSRFSHGLIKQTGEFVVNVPTRDLLAAVKLCGTKTGATTDKWEETGLTKVKSTHLQVPMVAECPMNIECRVKQHLPLGVHDMFLAEILGVHRAEKWEKSKITAISFVDGVYYATGDKI
ncbi:MAG: flavin reductase family protein [Candidatus Odinarchaeota archaeon]